MSTSIACRRLIVGISLLSVAALLIGCARKTPEPVKALPPVVKVLNPTIRLITEYEDFTGRMEPVKMVELKTRVTGYLDHVYFQDGQDVTEGTPLFVIDRRIYKAEFDRATAVLAKAEKHYATAEKNFKREDDLRRIGSGSKESFDKASGDLAEADADIGSARAALELAATNLQFTRISAPFDGRLSKRLVDPGNLVKADETSLTSIVALDTLYATFDVDERTVIRIRKMIQKGTVKSSREQPLVVRVGISDADDFPFSGLVTFVDNQLDGGTGTLRLRATIRNQPLTSSPWYMPGWLPGWHPPMRYLLSPGQFIRVRLPIGNAREAILVPEKAIGTDQGKHFLYVVRTQSKGDGVKDEVHKLTVRDRDEDAASNEVRLGPQFGNYRVIEGATLKTTDRIVVEGLLRVKDKGEVKAQPADKIDLPTSLPSRFESAPAPELLK